MVSVKEYVQIKKELLKGVIEEHDIKPNLLILEFDGDESSASYIKGIKKDCQEIGIDCMYHNVKNANRLTTQQAVNIIEVLQELNDFNAVIIQKPIPVNIDQSVLKNAITTIQDVDGFTNYSIYDPCTPKGVIDYLEYCDYPFQQMRACVVGRSNTIGRPLAKMLLDRDCMVTVCHSKTAPNDVFDYMRDSNFVFTCISSIEEFTDGFFNTDCDVIDFGIGIGHDGKLHGNIHHSTVKYLKENNEVNGHIVISGTGGTGLLTRVALMENVLKAAYGWRTGKVEGNE